MLPLGLTLLPARGAAAAAFTVNSLADTPDALPTDGLCADASGACTLRAAIQQANADASADSIGFAVNGTINLTGALPDLLTNMTISGPGAALLTVRRDTGGDYRILSVGPAATVAVSGLTISNGKMPYSPSFPHSTRSGGGVYNGGNLTLTGCVVSGNSTSDSPAVSFMVPGAGGGVFNEGTLTMTGCTVSDNFTGKGGAVSFNRFGGGGGGVANSGLLTMTDCLVTNNRTGDGGVADPDGGDGGTGGGVANINAGGSNSGVATLTNCTVSNNRTGDGGAANGSSNNTGGLGGDGGGVYNGASMTLVKSTVSGNTTGKGADARPGVSGGRGARGGNGGGVYNSSSLTAVNSVFDGNSTGRGGARGDICNGGNGGSGGGIANVGSGTLKLSQSTVVRNRTEVGGSPAGDCGSRGEGGGIFGGGRLRSNIIALNTIPTTSTPSSSVFRRFDLSGSGFDSRGYNYVGRSGDACCLTGTDRYGLFIDPNSVLKLDLSTLVPLPGSPALDSALALDTDDRPVNTDKRGAPRPFDDPAIPPQAGGDDSDMGAFERQTTDPSPLATAATNVHFGAATGRVTEGCVQTSVGVTRSGPLDGRSEVTYVVSDKTATQRGDFVRMRGHVTFQPGDESKLIPVLINEDAYAEGAEELIVTLTELEGGTLSTPNPFTLQIDDNDTADGASNPIDDNATFVCQHYHDFLNRQADDAGQAFWTGQLDACSGDPACLDRKREDVSAAFFLSIEFQATGYFAIRVNKAAFGDRPENPRYLAFLDETQQIARGVVVGRPGFAALLEANKQRYAEEFVARADFAAAHGGQNATQYVDSLFANAGVTPTQGERNAAVNAFGAGDNAGRAAALRSVVESGSVYNKLYNPAFVLMQYFAYLRRNPDDAPDNNFGGYDFWLAKLEQFTRPGEDARDESVALARVRRAEMVRAFLLSAEYRGRFQGAANRGS
jgi:CSLREA domain-containing protein